MMISKTILVAVLVIVIAVGVGSAVYVMTNDDGSKSGTPEGGPELRTTLVPWDSFTINYYTDPEFQNITCTFDGTNYNMTIAYDTVTIDKERFVALARYVGYIYGSYDVDEAQDDLKFIFDGVEPTDAKITIGGIGEIDCLSFQTGMYRVWSRDRDFNQIYKIEFGSDYSNSELSQSSPVDWALVEI